MKKIISSGFFGLTLLCFCLPWVTVSCQQQKITTFTGIQMATGTQIAEPGSGMFGNKQKMKKVDPNPIAIIALAAAIAALIGSFMSGKVSTVPAIIGILSMIVLKENIDEDILKQGEGLLNVSYESGFIGYFVMMICGTVTNYIPTGLVSENNEFTVQNSRKCPLCAETVKREALLCKHCNHIFTEAEIKQSENERIKSSTAKYCPRCDMQYSIGENVCHVCRMELINNEKVVANSQKAPKVIDNSLENDDRGQQHQSAALNICTECGTQNQKESLFCFKCGNKMQKNIVNLKNEGSLSEPVKMKADICEGCGMKIQQDDLFCSECGNQLA